MERNLKIYDYADENELAKELERIDDRITFRSFGADEMLAVAQEMLKIDILSLSYATRELLLNTLCHATAHYKISSTINWDSLLKIRDKIEEDLKEYIDVCMGA